MLGDQLNTLHDTRDDRVLDTGVFTLGIFTNGNEIDICVGCLITYMVGQLFVAIVERKKESLTFKTFAGSDIGK